MLKNIGCQICGEDSFPLDVVDFNKSCEEARGKFLPLAGISVYYYLCKECGFCFAPELGKWELNQFAQNIYNDKYIEVDPDYIKVRPEANARNLIKMFKEVKHIVHLDYGGGNGLLSNLVKESKLTSSSYDPFVDKNTDITKIGRFNLITAYEVFEHVPDVNSLMSDLDELLEKNGIILFSTLLSDGNIKPNQRLSWWYASPRNGHISLFSKKSIYTLAKKYNFNFGSFSPGFHIFCRKELPSWATHLIKIG
jgi:SAM-dependent methyltransferase